MDFVQVGPTRFAYQRLGRGPALLCLHGWPFTSATYRYLAPRLAEHFTCYLPDSPGLGLSEWTSDTPFDFPSQARAFTAFADALGLTDFHLLAHDTGATLGRLLAAEDARVRGIVLLNTEMPKHRPPWLPLYQKALRVPGSASVFRALLGSERFLRSPMGFGGCFHDPSRIDHDFASHYIDPLLREARRLQGALKYFQGIDWALIDGLSATHQQITSALRMVYGADDPTFPVSVARQHTHEFPAFDALIEIPEAKLLVHEERPEAVARAVCEHLLRPS